MNLPHWLELLLIVGDLALGVLICGVLIGRLLKRHFRWLDDNPRWYER